MILEFVKAQMSQVIILIFIFINLKLFRLRVWNYDKDKTVKNLDKVSGHHF